MSGSFRSKCNRWLLLLATATLTAAPTTDAADKPKVERSHRSAPGWTVKPPQADGKYLYFVGHSSAASSLEAAENDAAAAIVRQIVSLIGLEASFNYERIRSQAGLLLSDRLELAGDSRIVGLKRIETCYEKQTVQEGNTLKNNWNAHLLARYPVESLESETARLERLAQTRVSTAEKLLAEGRRLAASGFKERAWRQLTQGLETTGKISVVADPSTSSRMAVVRQRLVECARNLSVSLRRVAVGVIEVPDEINQDGAAISFSLEAALRDNGFTVEHGTEAASTGALAVVELTLTELNANTLEPGFNFSRWNAALSISDPSGRDILFAAEYQVKGFGIDPTRAMLDAMRKIRSEVLAQFAAQAFEQLEYRLAGEDRADAHGSF
jgi:hypothetical protein